MRSSLYNSHCLTCAPVAFGSIFKNIHIDWFCICMCVCVDYFQRPEEEATNSNQAADKEEEEEELRNNGPSLSRQNSSKKLVSTGIV